MSAEKPQGVNTGRIVSIVIGAALVAALGFFIYQYYSLKSTIEEKDVNIEELTAEIEDVEHELEDYKLDLENKDLALEEKERLLAEKEQLLQEKQKRIDELVRNNKISQSEAEKLRGKVESLEYYIKKYQGEIDELKRQIAIKDTQIDSLATNLGTAQEQVQTTTRRNEELEVIVEVGKILSCGNFTFFRTKGSGKEIEGEEFRAGQIDDLKICFIIGQNTVAPVGKRTAYLRIYDPKNKQILDESKSGYFKAEGEDMPWSTKQDFNFDHTATKICTNFNKPAGYEYGSGVHKVVVYVDGYSIGEGRFSVK
jgi:hypothetical protein